MTQPSAPRMKNKVDKQKGKKKEGTLLIICHMDNFNIHMHKVMPACFRQNHTREKTSRKHI